MDCEDKLVWGPSNKGQFSVRSAYYLELERKRSLKGESSKEMEDDQRWVKIWQLDVPGKVKQFLWRAGNNFLATRANLLSKKLVKNDACPICKEQKESAIHVLWQCVATNDVWCETYSKIQKWKTNEGNLLELFEKLLQKLAKEEMEEVVLIMWNIWIRRNQLVFENKFISPGQVINAAREQIRDFKMAQSEKEKKLHSSNIGRPTRWQKPNKGHVKVNLDASIDKKMEKMGIGIVIRDEMGEALTTYCDQKKYVQHPATAECIALWKAMEINRDLGFHRVMFEGDAQNIVKAINEDNTDYPIYGSIVHDAKKMLQQQQGWKVQYVHRTSNEVAHKLAKQALCLESELIWMEDMPTFISDRIDTEKQCIDDITQS